jgi:hypothetical protein
LVGAGGLGGSPGLGKGAVKIKLVGAGGAM